MNTDIALSPRCLEREEKDRTEEKERITQPLPMSQMSPISVSSSDEPHGGHGLRIRTVYIDLVIQNVYLCQIAMEDPFCV